MPCGCCGSEGSSEKQAEPTEKEASEEEKEASEEESIEKPKEK